LDVGLETSKEILDALKYVGERILAGRNGLGRLRERVVRGVEAVESKRYSLKEERLSR
jgi:hypothetical protein